MVPTRFGPQAIRERIWEAGFSHQQFAEMTGIKPVRHVIAAISGHCPPNPALRKAASEILSLPPAALWSEDALRTVYRPRRLRNLLAREAVTTR